MNESNPSDDALAELLSLTVEVNQWEPLSTATSREEFIVFMARQ